MCAYVEQITLILVSKINFWQIPLMLAYIYATLKNLCYKNESCFYFSLLTWRNYSAAWIMWNSLHLAPFRATRSKPNPFTASWLEFGSIHLRTKKSTTDNCMACKHILSVFAVLGYLNEMSCLNLDKHRFTVQAT